MKQLTEKQTLLQQELVKSDQTLTAARTEIEALKAQVTKLKEVSWEIFHYFSYHPRF